MKKDDQNDNVTFIPKNYSKDVTKKMKEVNLTFKYNRSFELHIGRKTYKFTGRENKNFPSSILEHPDFTETIRKYFVIKEI